MKLPAAIAECRFAAHINQATCRLTSFAAGKLHFLWILHLLKANFIILFFFFKEE
jgi:hypothetical protein